MACIAKDNAKANQFREIGNTHYRKKTPHDLVDALTFYNKCLCFAENGSDLLSIGYANRSAVYFELKLFNVCLENIEMARNTGRCPNMLMDKLDKLQNHCNISIAAKTMKKAKERKKANIPPLVPKLSYPASKTVPYVADCLELYQNKKYGRHIIANRNLDVGDIIAIEDAFCVLLPREKLYGQCDNCFIENSRSLIPCKYCTAVMYCSEKCYDVAMKNYHQYECPIIDDIHKMLKYTEDVFPLRMTFRAIANFGSVNDLTAFLSESDGQNNNVFNMDLGSTMGISPRESYAQIYSIQKETSNLCRYRLFYLPSIYLELMRKTSMTKQFPENLLLKLIRHHIQLLPAPIILEYVLKQGDVSVINDVNEDVALGMYPFRSLINHACLSNIAFTFSGTRAIVSVLAPIKAGEQLFESYSYG